METQLTINDARNILTAPLSDRARDYVHASKSSNTLRAYRPGWDEFKAFCTSNQVAYLPALPETIIEYLTALAEQGQKVSTIKVKLAAITFAHRGEERNPAQSAAVKTLMQGIQRKLGCAPTKKAPIARAELFQMLETLEDSLQGKRDRAILLLGFAGAFRRSEIATLNVEDVHFGKSDMTVTLRRSKTDQEGAGITKRIPMLNDAVLCPVRSLRAWLDAAPIKSGPLFRSIDRWGNARSGYLDDKSIAVIIKRTATAAGLEARQFSGHSLRAGFATQAATDETPEWEIAEVTGHKSPAVLRGYIRSAGLGQLRAIKSALGENENAPTRSKHSQPNM